MPNIERKVIIDVSQPDEALIQLRASLRLPDRQITELVAHLKELKSETGKLAISIQPTKDGLAGLTATFRTQVQEAESLSSALRQLIIVQNAVAASTRGSAEAQKAELAERRQVLLLVKGLVDESKRVAAEEASQRKRGLEQIAASQLEILRLVRQENEERKRGLQQINAVAIDLKKSSDAQAAIQKAGVTQVVAEQENVTLGVRKELAVRKEILQVIKGQQENLQVTAKRERELVPVNSIDAFNRAMLGGAEGVRRFQEAQNNAQTAARTFSSVLIAHPVQALRTLFTDARAAGAGVAFLKAQLDFIINSRFGSIALGFAIFGTAISTISRLTKELVAFGQEFSRIQALSLGQADAAQVNAKAQDILRDTALKTGISLAELTIQFRQALQATSDITVAEALFTNALQLSLVAGTEFGQTLLQLSGVFNVFGPQLGTAITAQEKLKLITSQLFSAFGEGRAKPDEFIQAIKFVGGQASLSGVPLTRLLAIVGVLGEGFQEGSRGGRGFSQVLSTISSEAQKFNERFSLGFTEGQITESPILAIDELLKRIEDGRLSLSRFRAEVTDLFPQNAERILLTFQKLSTELGRFERAIANAQDISRRTEIVVATTGTAFRQLGAIALETFIGAVGGADAFRSTLLLTAQVAGAVGAGVVFIATGVNQVVASVAGLATILLAISDDLSRFDLRFSVTREAAKIVTAQIQALGEQGLASGQRLLSLGNDALKAAGDFDEVKKKALEAEKAFEDLTKARVSAGLRGLDPTPRQQVELDLLNGITVSLERRLGIQREIVAKAEEDLRTAFKRETQERAFKTLVEERKRLIELELSSSKEALEELHLRSDQITESNRLNAVVTEQAARSEIRARRGIIAEIQQQQAAVAQLIESNRIGEREGTKQLDSLQKFLNQQLQLSRQVEEAARTATQQRVRAFRQERDAGENLADLQLRQAQQRIDAETTVRKARERILKDTRQLEDQQRKTLETQALGRVRLLLGFPEQANELLLTQLDRIRQAQEFANLPLREREQLLRQEFALLEKLKGKEEERLDQEILFGKDFANIIESQRRAVEGFLAADPVRQAAAQRKARLKFGRVTPEGILAAGGEALGIRGLVPETAEEERRNIREIEGMGGRRVELEKVIRGQLDEELQRSKELERERHEAISEANVALNKAISDQVTLLQKQPIELRKATEALQDAQQERLRIEKQFTDSTVQGITDRKAAIAAAEAAGTATRRDVATEDLTEEERLRRIRDITEVMRQVGRQEVPGTQEFEQFQKFRDEALRQQQQFIQPERPRVFLQSFQFQESLETPLIRANVEMSRLQERSTR